MGTLWHDFRHGVRTLGENPGFTAVAVLTLTLGIGANLALFGILNEMLLRLVLSTGLRLGLFAVAIGLPLALGAGGLLRHQIAGISPFDPVSFIAVAACVLAALLAACWLPARQAAKIDPMAALRWE